jgi:SAM-dependent methyltransferase
VADIPFELSEDLAQRLRSVMDVEGKIPRALDVLGPLASRRVGFLDVPAGPFLDTLCADTAEAAPLLAADPLRFERADGSLDAIVSLWSGFRGVDEASLAEADRVLAPGGRLLVVHDYGRDDVSSLADPEAPQYRTWSRREGPFLRGGGFKVRVLHCFWTFDSVEDAQAFLTQAFGERGAALGASLKRPRLTWNVAVYHRWRGGVEPEGTVVGGAIGAA